MKKTDEFNMTNRCLEDLYDLLDMFRFTYFNCLTDQQISKIVEVGNLVWSKRRK